jgi:predicted NAD/FAD-dependent oxidoreductase
MNAQLNHIVAQQRIADLQRPSEHARLATDAGTRRRDSNRVVRALPMPTAHPSPEAWHVPAVLSAGNQSDATASSASMTIVRRSS